MTQSVPSQRLLVLWNSCARPLLPGHSDTTRFLKYTLPLVNYVTCNCFSNPHEAFLVAITKIFEPRYYHEVAKDPRWNGAMGEEIRALEANQTWIIKDLPHGKKSINCKWVCKVNYKSDGTIERYKAHLVVQGDHYLEGFDFNETFAPTAKMASVRVLLSVAVEKG